MNTITLIIFLIAISSDSSIAGGYLRNSSANGKSRHGLSQGEEQILSGINDDVSLIGLRTLKKIFRKNKNAKEKKLSSSTLWPSTEDDKYSEEDTTTEQMVTTHLTPHGTITNSSFPEVSTAEIEMQMSNSYHVNKNKITSPVPSKGNMPHGHLNKNKLTSPALSKINVSHCHLDKSKLTSPALSKVNVSHCHLDKSKLTSPVVSKVNVSQCHMNKTSTALSEVNVPPCHLNKNNLTSPALTKVNVSHCHLNKNKFSPALSKVNVSHCHLNKNKVTSPVLSKVNVCHCHLNRNKVTPTLSNVNVSHCHLNKNKLTSPALSKLNVSHCHLNRNKLTSPTLSEEYVPHYRLNKVTSPALTEENMSYYRINENKLTSALSEENLPHSHLNKMKGTSPTLSKVAPSGTKDKNTVARNLWKNNLFNWTEGDLQFNWKELCNQFTTFVEDESTMKTKDVRLGKVMNDMDDTTVDNDEEYMIVHYGGDDKYTTRMEYNKKPIGKCYLTDVGQYDLGFSCNNRTKILKSVANTLYSTTTAVNEQTIDQYDYIVHYGDLTLNTQDFETYSEIVASKAVQESAAIVGNNLGTRSIVDILAGDIPGGTKEIMTTFLSSTDAMSSSIYNAEIYDTDSSTDISNTLDNSLSNTSPFNCSITISDTTDVNYSPLLQDSSTVCSSTETCDTTRVCENENIKLLPSNVTDKIFLEGMGATKTREEVKYNINTYDKWKKYWNIHTEEEHTSLQTPEMTNALISSIGDTETLSSTDITADTSLSEESETLPLNTVSVTESNDESTETEDIIYTSKSTKFDVWKEITRSWTDGTLVSIPPLEHTGNIELDTYTATDTDLEQDICGLNDDKQKFRAVERISKEECREPVNHTSRTPMNIPVGVL